MLATGKLMPQCIKYFVRHKQINATVYLLNTGKLMPSVFVKHKKISALVHLLDTGKLTPPV